MRRSAAAGLLVLLVGCSELRDDIGAPMFATPAPVAPPAPTKGPGAPVAAAVGGRCETFERARDGYKTGFIFLQSKTKGVAKVIFPSRFKQQFWAVWLAKDGKTLDTYRWDGMHNPEAGGLRQHWIGTKPTKALPSDAVIHADSVCWRLGKMEDRID